MNTEQIAFQLGELTAQVKLQNVELHAVRTDVTRLVQADMLARGGKKMLYKVGVLCSTLGAGIAWAVEHAAKLLT